MPMANEHKENIIIINSQSSHKKVIIQGNKVTIEFDMKKNYEDSCCDQGVKKYKKDVTQFLEFSGDFKVLNDCNKFTYQTPYYGETLMGKPLDNIIPSLAYYLFVFKYILKWDHGDIAVRNLCCSDDGVITLIDFDNYNRCGKNMSSVQLMEYDIESEDLWLFELYEDLDCVDKKEEFLEIFNGMRKIYLQR